MSHAGCWSAGCQHSCCPSNWVAGLQLARYHPSNSINSAFFALHTVAGTLHCQLHSRKSVWGADRLGLEGVPGTVSRLMAGYLMRLLEQDVVALYYCELQASFEHLGKQLCRVLHVAVCRQSPPFSNALEVGGYPQAKSILVHFYAVVCTTFACVVPVFIACLVIRIQSGRQ